ncbi:nck-associated protein 5-like isoform X2 [Acipenser ruthenus]|uniref:nck-associated protein 5-like isoform X2 n=1 Tax=Acipenser ruthenus TaxID=7906 RepID=UPI002740F4F3|nr:nck-associated protein 5-like isoform X2 [Acipenser ruthenus]
MLQLQETMSDAAEHRECTDAGEPPEGTSEPRVAEMEGGEKSEELLERLRVLEAENSALALVNESQREAYERCLDEVANHVVQALLNQKDLREECIKLKMRVFDLERQNHTLSELFQQKLQVTPGSLVQTSEPVREQVWDAELRDSEKTIDSLTGAHTKTDGERTSNGSTGAKAPAGSMDALSPFFKKKAHILEVLRKLEETDPLKFLPSSSLSSFRDFGPTFTGHAGRTSLDSDIHEYVNGEGTLPEDSGTEYESCQSCLMFSHKSLDGLFKRQQGDSENSFAVSPAKEEKPSPADSSSTNPKHPPVSGRPVRAADGTSDPSIHGSSTAAETSSSDVGPSPGAELKPHSGTETYLSSLIIDVELKGSRSGEPLDPCLVDGKMNLSLNIPGAKITPQCKSVQSESWNEISIMDNLKHMKIATYQNSSGGPVISTEENFLKLECYKDYNSRDQTEGANTKTSLYTTTSNLTVSGQSDASQIAYCEPESNKQICNGSYFSNEACSSKKVSVDLHLPSDLTEKNSLQQSTPGKAKLILSPTSPLGLAEPKSSPISSPSRLLKFLKIPSMGERVQAANPLRLSPQLTRSSKIPCRNNNYEVYHSPGMARRAVTAECDRPQAASTKNDSYPSTHSAPTSPPKPEANLAMQSETTYSSPSAPKASRDPSAANSSKLVSLGQPARFSQKVPNYENVSDISAGCASEGSIQFLQKVHQTKLPSCSEAPLNSCQSASLDNKLNSPEWQQAYSEPQSPAPSADAICISVEVDQEMYTENPVWYKLHDHHSLPSVSVSHKSQNSQLYSSMKDRQFERTLPESVAQNVESSLQPPASKKAEASSSHKKPVVGKPPSESGHLPFKERLAALGKLKSTEDPPQQLGTSGLASPLEKKDIQHNGKFSSPGNNEKSKTAERQGDRSAGGPDPRHSKYTDSLDGKPHPKPNLGGYGQKLQGPCPAYESGVKSFQSSSSNPRMELETYASRAYVAKAEISKSKAGVPSSTSSPDSPQVLRNYMKCVNAQSPSSNNKTVTSPQGSPTKVPSKSPSKPPGQACPKGARQAHEELRSSASQKRSPKTCPNSEADRSKIQELNEKKNHAYPESTSPSSTKAPQPDLNGDKRPLAPSIQSAIEEKVMKGIEENMLKLQEQDRGQVAEVKQKASNGIASWFGLKKSKLPALNRKAEPSKFKEDKKEWKLGASSSSSSSKDAKKKLEVESLNISKLMAKAEDLRKALEEERAYVNGMAQDKPSGRGHPRDVVVEQTQNELSVVYRQVASDNFMQQLLNRVDERDIPFSNCVDHRRLSFDSKKSRPIFSSQRNGVISHIKSREDLPGVDKGLDLVSKDDITADESLVNSQHFAGSGSSTRTLDSGIGTFPLPDYAGSPAGKSIPKVKSRCEQESSPQGKLGPGTKVPRKARTLERELSSLGETFAPENYFSPALYSTALENKGSSSHLSNAVPGGDCVYVDAYGAHVRSPSSRHWTFPNLKASGASTDVDLGVAGDSDTAHHGPQLGRNVKPCATPGRDPGSSTSLPLPPSLGLPLPPSLGLGRRVKGRACGSAELGKDGGGGGGGGVEVVKERQDDMLSPNRPSVLETPESLSDSLYDSLSSCGSQG